MNTINLEIISCENGFIVLEGNSMSSSQQMGNYRKKWVCETPKELGILIEYLAEVGLDEAGK